MSMIVNPFVFGAGGGSPSANSIEFIDGADHYGNDIQSIKWPALTNNSTPASGVAGAHGHVNDDASWGGKERILVTPTDEISVRFRIRFRVDTQHEFLHLHDTPSFHLSLRRNSDDTLTVVVPGATHTSTDTYTIDTWYEMEVYLLVHDTTGAYRVKVDGVVPNKSGGGTMDQSGLDTKAGSSTTVTRVRIGSATLDTYTDDHVIDVSGADIELGQVETLYPNGMGDLAEMTRGGTDSGANWSQCDEAQSNNNTDYVLNTVADKRDCYAFQNRSIAGNPKAVQVAGAVTRNTSGTFTFKFFVRIAGVNYDGTQVFTATSDYVIYSEVWNSNPATGNAWTDSDIDGAQFGIKAIDANVRCSQLVAEVFVGT